ncbi:uncharacterized protein V6R79_015062 [Siganus canaliculatus]
MSTHTVQHIHKYMILPEHTEITCSLRAARMHAHITRNNMFAKNAEWIQTTGDKCSYSCQTQQTYQTSNRVFGFHGCSVNEQFDHTGLETGVCREESAVANAAPRTHVAVTELDHYKCGVCVHEQSGVHSGPIELSTGSRQLQPQLQTNIILIELNIDPHVQIVRQPNGRAGLAKLAEQDLDPFITILDTNHV